MQNKIFAVIDTNVLVSALFSLMSESNPARVIRKVIDGTITPVYNDEIINEYIEVLSRDKFPFKKCDIEQLISIFRKYGQVIHDKVSSDEPFNDKEDIVFYEVALSKKDSFLVTGNGKHFPKKPFIVSPAEMLEIIHAMENPGILSERPAEYGWNI